MRMNRCEKQLNNRGMTLIELLVAIAILGVIVVPFLHAFLTSFRTNLKAREAFRVTTVAQDITEGLKAYKVDEICYQYNFQEKDFRIIAGGGDVKEVRIDSSGQYTDVDPSHMPANPDTDLHASVYSADGGETYQFLKQKDGRYYFAMSGITYENKKYDAFISMNAVPYRAGGSPVFQTYENADKMPNEEPIAVVDRMNTDQDGFFVQDKESDDSAIMEMRSGSGEAIEKSNVERTIAVKIDNSYEPERGDYVKVTISYNYAGNIAGSPETVTYEKESVMFNNVETKEALRNLYLFYYPAYSDWKGDNLVIENEHNIPVTIYLIKQMNHSIPTAYYVNKYRLKLTLKEDCLSVADSPTVFCTNLNKNIMTNTDVPTQVEFQYNQAPQPFHSVRTKDLAASEVRDRLYDITVEIYNEGAALNGFPEKDRLLIFDGSKDD